MNSSSDTKTCCKGKVIKTGWNEYKNRSLGHQKQREKVINQQFSIGE